MHRPSLALGAQQHQTGHERERREPRRGPEATPYAAAWAGSVCAPASARCSTTASTAVPSEPPTRCSTFSCGVASESSDRSSEANAAVIAGMNPNPIPIPRTNITIDSHTIEVWVPTNPNGIVGSAVIEHADQRRSGRRHSGR